jgi:hypothetical protein
MKTILREGGNNNMYTEDYWYSLIAQIIQGQQEELKSVMLDQISEWSGKEINNIDELTIDEIKGWLIDNQQEINYAGLIK